MKRTDDNERDWPLTLALAVAAGLLRLVPDMPMNFAPVGALGLFAGARFRSWRAFVVPLAVMAASDLLLWGLRDYPPFDPFVYVGFALYVLGGWLLLGRSAGAGRIALVSVAASVQFFLITNFGVWLAASVPEKAGLVEPGQGVAWQDYSAHGVPFPVPVGYSRDLRGLTGCYVAALPFFRTNAPPFGFFGNTLIGDLLFSGLLFGLSALLRGTVFRPRTATVPAEGVAS
jgi:hypothetical protein